MRHEREGLVKTEAEVGISDASTSPGHHGLSATTRGEGGGTEGSPSELQRNQSCHRPGF